LFAILQLKVGMLGDDLYAVADIELAHNAISDIHLPFLGIVLEPVCSELPTSIRAQIGDSPDLLGHLFIAEYRVVFHARQ
jgi:hypothetical protein